MFLITALAVDITNFSTNLSGTPVEGDTLWIVVTTTGARAITWGTSFESSANVILPTSINGTLDLGFRRNTSTSKWRLVATA